MRGQQPAQTGLRALRELDCEHLDVCGGDGLEEALQAKRIVWIAATEIARANLPYQIAAVLVINTDAALADALQCSDNLATPVERQFRISTWLKVGC